MKLWKSPHRHTRKEIFLIVAMLFSTASVLQMLSIDSTPLDETLLEETSKYSNTMRDQETTGPVGRVNPEEQSEHKLLFQSVPDVVIPETHKVTLNGLQKLPKRFLQNSAKLKEEYRFRIEPTRIKGENGILAIREFQGNSWLGTLMKGAFVFLVHSSAHHSRRRMLIRSTWGAARDVEGWKIEVIFVVGQPKDSSQQESLVLESRKYGDLLQYEGPDKSAAQTSKVLAGLSWAARILPDDFYYASMPDNVLVNINSVRDHVSSLSNHFPPPGSIFTVVARDGSTVTSSLPQNVYCFSNYFESKTPERNLSSERSVNFQAYTASQWPPHCDEGLYMLPVSFARELYQESRMMAATLPDKLHDVLVTGILRRKMRRGDSNISTVPRAPNGDDMILRVKFLPRSTNSRLAQFELDAEDKFKTAWEKWYKPVQNRYHILTKVAPL